MTKFKINWDGVEASGENSENVPPKRENNMLSDNSQVSWSGHHRSEEGVGN